MKKTLNELSDEAIMRDESLAWYVFQQVGAYEGLNSDIRPAREGNSPPLSA